MGTVTAPISVRDAQALVLGTVKLLAAEALEPSAALGRVLAADLRAEVDLPPFSASAMDGYAIVAGPAGRRLPVMGESRAGAPSAVPATPRSAVRISTGAAVPDGATAVIRQEEVQVSSAAIETLAPTAAGENIRAAGEDIRRGETVLLGGTRLGWAQIAAAVAAGATLLRVGGRPRVGILCTGDELRAPGAVLGPGEIHNSNGPMLAALTRYAGGEPVTGEPLPDEREATERGIQDALGQVHVLIICGGVSVGPHDHVKGALHRLGVQERFWRVALQPGKPTWFGTRGDQLVFGLPGNPVSVAVTFTLFVEPALRALQGQPAEPAAAQATLTHAIQRSPDREQAVRVELDPGAGELRATPTGPQHSHRLRSLLGADALALIPAGPGEVAAGENVRLVALAGIIPLP